MQCNDRPFRGSNGPDDAAVRAIFELGTNNSSTYTPSLTDLFVNGATETALTAFDAATLDGFFDTTAYVGAVADRGRAACSAQLVGGDLHPRLQPVRGERLPAVDQPAPADRKSTRLNSSH